MLSNDTGAMAELAVAPRKAPKALTAEERLLATAKLRATRAARGTTSKKQKAKAKGNVASVVVTPVSFQGSATVSTATQPGDTAAAPPSPSPTSPPVPPAPAAVVNGAPVVPGALAPGRLRQGFGEVTGKGGLPVFRSILARDELSHPERASFQAMMQRVKAGDKDCVGHGAPWRTLGHGPPIPLTARCSPMP